MNRLQKLIEEANAKAVKPLKKPKRVSTSPSEDQEQIAIVAWLRLHGIRVHHSPNGGKRDAKEVISKGKKIRFSPTAVKFKRMGTSNGFPDLMIFTPPPLFPTSKGVAIEMKAADSGRASEEQKEWLEALSVLGWKTAVCHGAGEAIAFLESLGYGRRR